MADSSSNFIGSGVASSLVTSLGGLGLSALQNDGKEIQGKYQQSLAELNAKTTLSNSEYQIQLAKINAEFESDKADNVAQQSKSKLMLVGIIAGLAAVTAIIIVLIIKRSRPAVQPIPIRV